MKNIEGVIREAFPGGLGYDDAAQLCLALYSIKVVPEELMAQCTKDNLPIVFAGMANSGFIRVRKISSAPLYGSGLRDPQDKGHWVEMIASIFKKKDTINLDRGVSLLEQLTRR